MFVVTCTHRGFTFRLADDEGVLVLTGPQAQAAAVLHKRLFGYEVKIEHWKRQPRYEEYWQDNLLAMAWRD